MYCTTSMLAKIDSAKNWPGGAVWQLAQEISGYERNMLRAMKKTFAGRSPSRRMK